MSPVGRFGLEVVPTRPRPLKALQHRWITLACLAELGVPCGPGVLDGPRCANRAIPKVICRHPDGTTLWILPGCSARACPAPAVAIVEGPDHTLIKAYLIDPHRAA